MVHAVLNVRNDEGLVMNGVESLLLEFVCVSEAGRNDTDLKSNYRL